MRQATATATAGARHPLLKIAAGAICATLLLAGSARAGARNVWAGTSRTCAALSSGTVACWGKDYLTGGENKRAFNRLPKPVAGFNGATAVATNVRYTCALLGSTPARATGQVMCLGDDGYGQLGNGNTNDSATPVKVSGLGSAVSIAAGGYHVCAVLSSGRVDCWGRNDRGGLGNGTRAGSDVPVQVSGITNAVAVTAGYVADGSCALLATHRVLCWGQNTYGQLGNGNTTDSYTPVAVSGIGNAVNVAGGGDHSCAVLASGHVVCWGTNVHGALGNGTTTDSRTPVTVKGIANATAVAVAPGYACARLKSGGVECWGENEKGNLGNGTRVGSLTPVTVIGIRRAQSVSAGQFHACATLSTGGAECWGSNDYGALGNGSTTKVFPTPVVVAFGSLG